MQANKNGLGSIDNMMKSKRTLKEKAALKKINKAQALLLM